MRRVLLVMTEVHYVVLEKCLGRYNWRADRIEMHEGLKRNPRLLRHVLAHEWRHVEIRKNGKFIPIIGWRTLFLDYRSLWEIYRSPDLLDLYVKGVEDLDLGEARTYNLFLILFTKICRLINWVEGTKLGVSW